MGHRPDRRSDGDLFRVDEWRKEGSRGEKSEVKGEDLGRKIVSDIEDS
jgi:hypothetical protein